MKAYILSLNSEADLTKQWDFGLLKDLLNGDLWKSSDWVDIEIQSVKKLPKDETAIVAIPARHHAGLESDINKELKKISKVILFLMGDEEADFDITKIKHNNIHIWVQNPHIGKHDKYNKIGTGYPQHIHQYLPKTFEKEYEMFFAGQITHNRRTDMVDGLQKSRIDRQKIIQTEGFTQGLEKDEYYSEMTKARFVPCPSGAVIPDSFRLFESLECMAIPVADKRLPSGDVWEYWDWLFGEIVPFPQLAEWWQIDDLYDNVKSDWHNLMHKQTAWWIQYKRKLAYKLMEQINA